MRRDPGQSINLSRAITFSAIVHLIILALLIFSPATRLPLRERPIRITWVELPRGRSDEIGLGIKKAESLPTTTLEEQKKLTVPDEVKQQPLPPTKPKEVKDAPKERKTEIAERPKMKIEEKNIKRPQKQPVAKKDRKIQNALAKIDRQLKERSAVPEAAQVENEEGYKYGTSNKPLKVSPSDPEYLKYQAQVRFRIMREWIVPMAYVEGDSGLNARVEVMINTDGDVVSVRWASQSGNASFDQSALRAVKRASPFPKPPDRLAWEAYNEGFLVEFDPRIKQQY